jgi:uncharacterized protein (TIGR03437 family)
MSSITRFGLALLCAISGSAQPVLSSAVNSAGYQTPPKGDVPIAQGSIFVVFGSGLAATDLVRASSFPLGASLPATNGTSISITSGGQTISAYMVYTLPAQVAAILPSATPVGPATLTLTYNGQSSAPIHIHVVQSAPGVFTTNSQGTGPAVAQVAFTATDIRANNLTTPATPGSVVVVYGTGLGPINGADNVPPGAIDISGTVTATIGGTAATVLYAGRAPEFPGLDQINLQLTGDVPLGCYTPGVITVNGIPSNDFVLSTAAAGSNSCVHPFSLSQTAEAVVDAGGAVSVGVFTAARGTIEITTTEGLGGLFGSFNGSQLFAAFAAIVADLHATLFPAPVGSCVVYDQLSKSASASLFPASSTSIGARELQSAKSLTLSGFTPGPITGGSTSVMQAIARAGGDVPGYLWTNTIVGPSTPAIFGFGNWSLFADTGPDVSAFSANIELPDTLVWTGMTGFNTPSRGGVTITWTGGYCAETRCPKTTGAPPNVQIFGNSSVFNPADPSRDRGKSFACTIPAPVSIFTIPPEVTSALPVAGADEFGTGSLGISVGILSPFVALLTNGQRTDGGVFAFAGFMVNSGSTFSWR